MNDPLIRIVVTVLVALVCLGLAVPLGTKAVSYTLAQIRAMRPQGADTKEAATARVLARGKLKNLAFLFVFSAVPATISYAHLIDYARQSLELTGGLEYLVPLALDEAALYLMMLAFADVDADESSAGNRLLVWAFAGASAWFNWIQAPRGDGHEGAPQFFAAMSLAAGILFERGLVNVRRAARKAKGNSRRPLPRVGVLRWATAPRETAGMMRLAITEPDIRTEVQALAAVRVRRALRSARKEARRAAEAEAAAQAPGRWWRRRTVLVTAQPTLALPADTAVPATALATVLDPYVRAERASTLPEDTAQPLSLEPLLKAAAQIGTPAQHQDQMTALTEHVERLEALAAGAENAITAPVGTFGTRWSAHDGMPGTFGTPEPVHGGTPLPNPRAEAPSLEPVEASGCADDEPDCEADEHEKPANVPVAAAAQTAGTDVITARVPDGCDEETEDPGGEDVLSALDLGSYTTKRAALEALYHATISKDDSRSHNAIAEELRAALAKAGRPLDRGSANRYVAALRPEPGTAGRPAA